MSKWTDEEIYKLLTFRRVEKRTYPYIAKRLKRSKSSCRNKFDEVMRDFTREENAEDIAA